MPTEDRRHYVLPENVAKIVKWLRTRGGVAVWRSVNLSNPNASWSTPAYAVDGTPTRKPNWQAQSMPSQIITDPAEIYVTPCKEVKRFHVALRVGSQGFMLKLTDASARKLHAAKERATAKYGAPAWHEFDYERQEAVIYVQTDAVPLNAWLVTHPTKEEGSDHAGEDEGSRVGHA